MVERLCASDLMTPNPVTVDATASAAEAAELLRQMDIRHLPVVERGALVGILSDRDLRGLGPRAALDAEAQAHVLTSIPVVKVMSTDLITIGPETGLAEIVSLMIESKVGAIPVIEAETRELMGIVSYIDVLRAVEDLVED